MKNTLKNKLSWSIIVVISFFGFIATLFIFYQTKTEFIDQAKQNLHSVSRVQINGLDNIFQRGRDLVTTIATEPVIMDYMMNNKEPADELTTERLNRYNVGDIYSAIYLMSTNGVALVSTDPTFVGQNYSFRDYFQIALDGELWIDMAIGVTSKEVGYYFSFPIKAPNGDVIGVAVAKMKPELINKFIMANNIRGDEKTMISDNYGIVFFSNDSQRIYKSLGVLDNETLEIVENKKRYLDIKIDSIGYGNEALEFLEVEDTQVFEINDKRNSKATIVSVARIGELPFFVLTERNLEQFINPAIEIAFFLTFLVSLTILGAIFFIIFFVNRFLRPIEFLEAGAYEISRGNFDNKIIIKTGDELGELADSFNKMSRELCNSYNNLKNVVQKLERMNKLLVGREKKMFELKQEIKKLKNN